MIHTMKIFLRVNARTVVLRIIGQSVIIVGRIVRIIIRHHIEVEELIIHPEIDPDHHIGIGVESIVEKGLIILQGIEIHRHEGDVAVLVHLIIVAVVEVAGVILAIEVAEVHHPDIELLHPVIELHLTIGASLLRLNVQLLLMIKVVMLPILTIMIVIAMPITVVLPVM